MSNHRGKSGGVEQKNRGLRKRITRACDACRRGKTKCDGADPCTACRSGKSKRKTPCGYSQSTDRVAIPPDNQTVQESLRSESYDRESSPIARRLQNRLSLSGVVEEVLDIDSTQGRAGQQINQIQYLWSYLEKAMTNDPTRKTHGSGRTPSFCPFVFDSEHIDTIRQMINQGMLIEAWNAVGTCMRQLEAKHMQEGLSLPVARQPENMMASALLELVNWECALSFYIGGSAQIPSWSQGRFLSPFFKQQMREDALFAKKLDLFSKIQEFISIDLSHEEGLCKLLHQIIDVKSASPAPTLEELAINTTNEDSVAEHELKFVSNLVFVMLYCRTATICACYASRKRYLSNKKFSDVLGRSEFSKGRPKTQAVKHASVVLDVFEVLCVLDSEGTAKSWFRLYGALVATVLLAIAELRTRRNPRNSVKVQIQRIRDWFETLQPRNTCNPLFENSIVIFEECLRGEVSAQPHVQVKTTIKKSRKHARDNSPLDEKPRIARKLLKSKAGPQDSFLAELHADRGKVEGESPANTGKRKLAQVSVPVQSTHGFEPKEGSFDPSWSNNASFVTTYDSTPSPQSNLPPRFVNHDVDVSSSLGSNTSTTIAQSPMSRYGSSGYLTPYNPLLWERPSSAQHIWPQFPPLAICQPPLTMWPGQYFSVTQPENTMLVGDSVNCFGNQVQQQSYPEDTGVMSFENHTPGVACSPFDQYGTSSMEGSGSAVSSFGAGSTIGLPVAAHPSTDRAPRMNMETCLISSEL